MSSKWHYRIFILSAVVSLEKGVMRLNLEGSVVAAFSWSAHAQDTSILTPKPVSRGTSLPLLARSRCLLLLGAIARIITHYIYSR